MIEELTSLSRSHLMENEPMEKHTTFKIGGPARWFLDAGCEEDVERALSIAKTHGLPAIVIGRGSNLLVADRGLDALVIEIGNGMSQIHVDGCSVTAQAGARLSVLSQEAARHGLSGLEFAAGIPGGVGGGTAMNAGAYGGQMSDVLTNVRAIEDGRIVDIPAQDMELGYRQSRILKRNGVVLSASFALTPDDPARITERLQELNRRRREKQPLSFPSAGSVFKRPEGYFAGALIEGAGLKGCRIGDAMVSPLHAGFIVNVGHATAEDVRSLIEHIQNTVYQKDGVRLETEVRMLGF